MDNQSESAPDAPLPLHRGAAARILVREHIARAREELDEAERFLRILEQIEEYEKKPLAEEEETP